MQAFCPTCANMLLLKQQGADSSINSDATVRYACTSCSYQYAVERRVATGLHLEKKEVAEVLQEEGAWKGVPTTAAPCEKCGHNEAYFKEVQIRSADEPATVFYKCCKCTHTWREG